MATLADNFLADLEELEEDFNEEEQRLQYTSEQLYGNKKLGDEEDEEDVKQLSKMLQSEEFSKLMADIT